MAQQITQTQASEYAMSLFAGSAPMIWDVRQSGSDDDAIDVEVYCPEMIGGDGFTVVTTWLENGQPYGEW